MWDPKANAEYELTPRVHDERLPRCVFYVSNGRENRIYAQRRNVRQWLNAMPLSDLSFVKVYMHRTEVYVGLHGWMDVTNEFIPAVEPVA